MSKVEMRPLMASRAIRKIIAAEGPSVVMAGHATLCARWRVMLKRRGRSDLSGLWQSGLDVVAIGTTQTLARMPDVAEVDAVGLRPSRRPRVASELMTCAA